jgi:aryl-alcohol dehydrogenase-like predicted oxidoreductase
MISRPFGKTGMDVSLLGFGGSEIGYPEVTVETVGEILNAALDAGLNVIDTAECYRNSEEKIGKAVSHRRSSYYLFTKCGHASGFEYEDWDPKMLRLSIDRSLERLQTDYVDLVQLHTCSEAQLRQGDVIDVLLRAREAGKTRFIGYSGDNEAASFAVASGVFDSLQTSCSIADQNGIDGWIKEAAAAGMGLIIKRPIANYAWNRELQEGAYAWDYQQRLKALEFDFLKTSEDVSRAMRFTASVPGVSTMIVGTTKPNRWQENARLVLEGPLDARQFEEIREIWRERSAADWVGLT